jgi:predicted aminopeptidase
VPLLTGCQAGYLIKSGYFQAKLLSSRIPIEKALEEPTLSDEQKRKLRLTLEVRKFAESELGLKHTTNYTTFVQLERPYVTYVVSASSRTELKAYKWWFPVVGSVPYKGFFDPESAKAEADKLKARGYDVYVRGVSAYSTLGWFSDPMLSSMLNYKDHDLVDTVIHETVHATVYIKSEADFNERMAVFFGSKGAEAFYLKKEGPESPTLRIMESESHDEKLFADFMSSEMKSLEEWYKDRAGLDIPESDRIARIKQIQTKFIKELKPQFKLPDSYKNFENAELNNARLLTYRLYFEKIEDFDAVFKKLGSDFRRMLEFCRSLQSVDDPRAELARAAHDPS